MKLEELFESKWLGWVILALLYLLVNFAVVGMNRWEFYYGLIYMVFFFALAFLMFLEKPNFLAAGLISLMGFFVIFISDGFIPSTVGLISVSVLFGAAFAGQFVGKFKSDVTKWLIPIPFVALLGYYVTGLYLNIILNTSSIVGSTVWILTRTGIAVMAVDGFLKAIGFKNKVARFLLPLGLLLAVIGALYLTLPPPYGLDRGLGLFN